jgi:cellulose synthase/poly-beta-1,6-N-acetylglucosamine synthase-like glycosyltransferase
VISTFQIIVPVYNEEDVLPRILALAASGGYLDKIVFVDDASMDGSRAVLRQWVSSHAIRVVFLDRNRKKEGAIREVLESLEHTGTLAPYTVLLDSDSFITRSTDGTSIVDAIENAIASMREHGLAGLAFRIDAAIDASSNWIERCAFADYASAQFDHWLTNHQRQLWVINGPGGLFRSDLLLEILRGMQPDFETGDLLITAKLMSQGHRVAFHPDIQVQTFVPNTIKTYFAQRRRWERGTTKVIWWERAFYARLFQRGRLLAISTVIHLSLYVGIVMAAIGMSSPSIDALSWIVVSYLAWLLINLTKGFCNVRMRREGHWPRYVVFCTANGILWIFVTVWARCAGFIDAVRFLVRSRRDSGKPRADSDRAVIELS